jgi:hypothetical protein
MLRVTLYGSEDGGVTRSSSLIQQEEQFNFMLGYFWNVINNSELESV